MFERTISKKLVRELDEALLDPDLILIKNIEFDKASLATTIAHNLDQLRAIRKQVNQRLGEDGARAFEKVVLQREGLHKIPRIWDIFHVPKKRITYDIEEDTPEEIEKEVNEVKSHMAKWVSFSFGTVHYDHVTAFSGIKGIVAQMNETQKINEANNPSYSHQRKITSREIVGGDNAFRTLFKMSTKGTISNFEYVGYKPPSKKKG